MTMKALLGQELRLGLYPTLKAQHSAKRNKYLSTGSMNERNQKYVLYPRH